jgi:hypothetical protein
MLLASSTLLHVDNKLFQTFHNWEQAVRIDNLDTSLTSCEIFLVLKIDIRKEEQNRELRNHKARTSLNSFFPVLFRSDIDIIEWSHFLTPQLELSKLFQASPVGILLRFKVSTHFSCNMSPISHFPIEQRTGSSRLFGGKKTICRILASRKFSCIPKVICAA